jgi:hypothetical protein
MGSPWKTTGTVLDVIFEFWSNNKYFQYWNITKHTTSTKNFRAKPEYDPTSGICTLVITPMLAEDVGEYTCVAKSEFGTAQSTAQLISTDE